MSRKVSIRLPDDVRAALEKTRAVRSFCALVVNLVSKRVRGERPLAASDITIEFSPVLLTHIRNIQRAILHSSVREKEL